MHVKDNRTTRKYLLPDLRKREKERRRSKMRWEDSVNWGIANLEGDFEAFRGSQKGSL